MKGRLRRLKLTDANGLVVRLLAVRSGGTALNRSFGQPAKFLRCPPQNERFGLL